MREPSTSSEFADVVEGLAIIFEGELGIVPIIAAVCESRNEARQSLGADSADELTIVQGLAAERLRRQVTARRHHDAEVVRTA